MKNSGATTNQSQSMPLNADGSTPKLQPRKTTLQDPANHNLIDIFQELKFGRPAASQLYLQKCIEELHQISALEDTPN